MAFLERFPTACMAVTLVSPTVQAAYYQFNGTLTNGYAVQGVLETKASAPASFIESNPSFPNAPFSTQYLESASMSVSRLGSTLASGTPVFGGVSYEAYLHAAFDAATLTLSALDLQARSPSAGTDPYYFISNGVAPDATTVAFGTTTFNLFLFNPNGLAYTYLGSTSSLSVTAIPAPASLLAFVLLPARRQRRR